MCLCAPSYTCIGQRYDVHSGVAIFTPSELSLNDSKQDGSWCHLREHDEIRPLVHLFGGVRTSASLLINTRAFNQMAPPITRTRRGPPAAAPGVGLHLALEARRSARGERSADKREHCAASRSVARGAKEGV